MNDIQEKRKRMMKSEKGEISERRILSFIIMSLAFLFFFECTRELLGTIYNLNLATMSLNSSLIAILAFFSPLFFFFKIGSVHSAKLMAFSGVILTVCRIGVSLHLPLFGYLVTAFLGVASSGIFLTGLMTLSGNNVSKSSRVVYPVPIYAAITGAGGDLFFRAMGNTFDSTIYGFSPHPQSSLLLVIPLALLFCIALTRWYRNQHEKKHSDSALQRGVTGKIVWYGISLGAVAFLFLTIFAYPNTVSRWTGGSYAVSLVVQAGALGGAILCSVLSQGKRFISSPSSGILGGLILLVTAVFLIYTSRSMVINILSGLSLGMLPILFFHHLSVLRLTQISTRQIGAFFTIAAGSMICFMIFSVFTLTHSYVPGMEVLRDQIGTLLMIAAVIVGITTLITWSSATQISFSSGQMLSSPLLILLGISIIIAPSLCVVFYPEPHPAHPQSESLVLMTYNIHQGYNTEGKINPWDILEPFNEINPHVIVLQESDMNRITSTNVDIVRWLAQKLDMYSYFGPPTRHQIYGVTILSKFPLIATETYFLTSREDQRVLIRGDIEYRGSRISIYGVHIGLSEEDRTIQTAQILDILSRNPLDKILMGDLNSTPDSPQMEAFLRLFSDVWTAAGHSADDPSSYTFSSTHREKHIDYILIMKAWESRVKDCAVISDVYASDHLPMWTEIILT